MEKIKRFLFSNTSIKQTIVKNTFWLAASTTATKIIRSVIIIYAARLIGTEGYGIFTYAMSLAALFTIFSDIGLTGILTRELSKQTEKDQSYIATLSFVKIGFLSIATLLIVFVGPLVAKFPEAQTLMPIIALLLAFDSLRTFVYSITRSESKMQVEAGYEFATEIVITVLCLLSLLISPSPYTLALAYMIGSGLGLVTILCSFRTTIKRISGKIRKSLIRPILVLSLPFAIVGVFNVFLTNIDSVIIGIWNDASTLGIYGAAQRPMSILYLLPGFLSVSIFPIMSKLSVETDTRRASMLVKSAATLSIMLALPIVVGGIILAFPLINTVFGPAYIGAVPTFKILLLTLLPIFPGIVFYYILFAENRQSTFMKSSGIGAVVNIVLDLILIPRIGIVGSAIATLCAQSIATLILFIEIRKRYQFHLLRDFGKIGCALLGMTTLTLLLFTLSVPLLLIIPLGAITYITLLFLLKEKILMNMRGLLS